MSSTDFAFPGNDTGFVIQRAGFTTISLNQLFKAALKKIQDASQRAEIIVRCESLPDVEGNSQQLSLFFETLLGLILEPSMNTGKLFIYLHCEEDKRYLPGNNSKTYHIRFHTNLGCDQSWKERTEKSVMLCRQILTDHGGSFMVNNINNTGCLFSIILPGKF